MHWYEMKLSGKGRTSSSVGRVCRPERIADVPKYLEQVGKNGIVVRGSASSYADQTLNTDGAVMMSGRLDCIRSFNEETGELICEPGVTLETITRLYGARGFMLATASGSGQHTLGGALGANIVGQNGHKKTSLACSVNWMDVVLADGQIVRASLEENEDLFRSVIGGQGMIGIIVLVSINLLKKPALNVVVEKRRITNLNDLIESLRTVRKSCDFCSVWVDTSARSDAIGRGILKTASFTKDPVDVSLFSVPKRRFSLPQFVLHMASWSFFQNLRYHFFSDTKTVTSYEEFLYPSDYVRVFSSKGVYQLQISFSEAEGPQALRRILTELSQSRITACRAVLVLTKKDRLSYLGFALHGYTISLDFIRRKGLEDFLKHLITIATEHNGRVSLQDDALLEPRNLIMMYDCWDKFVKVRETLDPQKKFDSDFARRLFVREKKNEQ